MIVCDKCKQEKERVAVCPDCGERICEECIKKGYKKLNV